MGVIVLEGLAVTALVLVGFREAVINAIPLSLKRAIGAGIGLFILFIGFNSGGLIASTGLTPAEGPPRWRRSCRPSPGQFVFLFGLALTAILWARRIQGGPDHLDPRDDHRRACGRGRERARDG